tara:strand:- start:1714 stop:2184 length:471 start_codon:yes stop_codon:yes gene_type:complete
MIITCPGCKKRFNVDTNLITDKGRLLKCGTCDETWFFKKKDQTTYETKENITINDDFEEQIQNDKSLPKYDKIDKKISNIKRNKGSELIRYRTQSSSTISNFLSYIIVFIISFIGFIIILDTFKSPLSVIFPNLELLLYNLFETLRDLLLFAKDLK